MPVGPSHGSHGGGSHGGGSHGGSHSHSGGSYGGSLVGSIVGGLIAGAINERRRRRFEEKYGYSPNANDYQSVPQRQKPVAFIALAVFFIFFSFILIIVSISSKNASKSYSSYIQTMESDWIEYKDLFEKAENGVPGYYTTQATFLNDKHTYYSENPSSTGYYLDFEEGGISYYFIVYEFVDAVDGKTYKGTTYTQFSDSQIKNLPKSGFLINNLKLLTVTKKVLSTIQ